MGRAKRGGQSKGTCARRRGAGARLAPGGGDEGACQGEKGHEWNVAEAEAAEVRRRRTALPALGGRSLNLLTRRLTLQVHQSLLGFCAGRAGAHEWENATPQDGTGGQAITESSPSPIFARGVEGEGPCAAGEEG